MKIVFNIVLVVLVLLALLSGAAKVALTPQEVSFFGQYGFTSPLIIAFGVVQLVGGALMPFPKTRFVGAALVAVTFLVSLVLLFLDGSIPAGVVTTVMLFLLGWVMKRSLSASAAERSA